MKSGERDFNKQKHKKWLLLLEEILQITSSPKQKGTWFNPLVKYMWN